MSRRLRELGLLCALALVGVMWLVSCGSSAQPSAWGDAIEVPGTAALNDEGQAAVTSVSCSTAGNCVAGGEYQNSAAGQPAFVADETNGSWGNAIEVPGMATLDRGGSSVVNSVSCTAAGNCAAGGNYSDGDNYDQAFVVDETDGHWGKAIEVPGTAALNTAGDATVATISCATPGNCAAGGYYSEPGQENQNQAFVVDETDGHWGNAIAVPGTATLNAGGAAEVYSVSCTTPGNCTAGGRYADGDDTQHAFVVEEKNGSWGTVITLRGALTSGGAAGVWTVSCTKVGYCTAGGGSDNRAFVVDETNGRWGIASEVRVPTLSKHAAGYMYSVSCATPGNCAAAGSYDDRAFVLEETKGKWGTAIEVPGSGRNSAVTSISCAAPGNCSAGGFYTDRGSQGFVVDETNGSWEKAIQVPGTATLNSGHDASVESVSCATATDCSAGGSYSTRDSRTGDGGVQAFVVSRTGTETG
jgi:hypothetical protein